jgi:phosphatidylserine/phosphatidylglycerophosphate/cardiolipin synthase-like enzyme
MKEFFFSNNLYPRIIDELNKAQKYIRIAVFQFHSDAMFDVLEKKLREGVAVEIFTLPLGSVNESVVRSVEKRFEIISKKGAKLFLCRWNVGDPERTTTAMNQWYSFHGKFIVTDKSAIVLSANLFDECEYDTMIVYSAENEMIKDCNLKFDMLLQKFVIPYQGYEGSLRSEILSYKNKYPSIETVFELPKTVTNKELETVWVKGYPAEMCPTEVKITDSTYISPFDCRARNLIEKIALAADKFVYISTESLTDEEMPNFLKKIRLSGLVVNVLTGSQSMDYSDRLKITIKEMLASGINIKTTVEGIHAKLLITDKLVGVLSINLNKISLGFKSGGYWRANTETIAICSDKKIIAAAKEAYEEIFNNPQKSTEFITKLVDKSSVDIGKLINRSFDFRVSSEAKRKLAELKIKNEIKDIKELITIIKGAISLAKKKKKNKIDSSDVLLAQKVISQKYR